MRRSLIALLCAAALAAGGACARLSAASQAPTLTWIVHASTSLPSPDAIASLPGVAWSRFATSAMLNLVRVDGGRTLKRRDSKSVLPFDVEAAEPLPGDDAISTVLAGGDAVVPTSSAAGYALKQGSWITLGRGAQRVTLRVGLVADDPRTVESEALIPLAAARKVGVDDVRDVVVGISSPDAAAFGVQARALAAPVAVRVGDRNAIATPPAGVLLSLGDIKRRFGEFAFVKARGRWLEPDPAWVKANIVQTSVPVIGRIECNRHVIPALTAAMNELEREGLSYLVREQASCYAPRVQAGDATVISRHSWGIAIDINPSTNRFGLVPTQDLRLVHVMRAFGFAWGGVWLIPDGMHFEYAGAPA